MITVLLLSACVGEPRATVDAGDDDAAIDEGAGHAPVPSCTGPDVFDDPAMAARVRETVGSAPFTAELLATVRELSVQLGTSTSLAGFECLKSLESLRIRRARDVERPRLPDLSPLGSLTKLTSLDIRIASGPLRLPRIPSLIELSLAQLQLEELPSDAFVGFDALRSLSVAENNLSDVSFLAAIPQLTELSLSSNRVRDLRPLSGLTELETLYIEYNDVDDLRPIATLDALTLLGADGNAVSDVSPLLDMESLREVFLNDNAVDCAEQAEEVASIVRRVCAMEQGTVSTDCVAECPR